MAGNKKPRKPYVNKNPKITSELLDQLVAEVKEEKAQQFKQAKEDVKDCMITLLKEGQNNLFHSDLRQYCDNLVHTRDNYCALELYVMIEEILQNNNCLDSEQVYQAQQVQNLMKEWS